MAFLQDALQIFFNKSSITSPSFIKNFNKENEQLRDLMELSNKLASSKKDTIDRDINLLKQGLAGKQNVYYELKNSFLPILYLHDVRLEISKMEGVKPYFVFTNAQLDSLIEVRPKNKKELLKVSGFGEKKEFTIFNTLMLCTAN